MVRPGGKLAITTWGPRIFSPVYEVWLETVRGVRPDLHSAYNPWHRITSPESVAKLCLDAGIPGVDVVAEDGQRPLAAAEDFWTVALGSGLRWTIEQMGPDAASDVRQSILEWMRAQNVKAIETNVIYAVATRP